MPVSKALFFSSDGMRPDLLDADSLPGRQKMASRLAEQLLPFPTMVASSKPASFRTSAYPSQNWR
jgi:hypothetical protein